MFLIHFRIRYTDPLGNIAYYHAAAESSWKMRRGETFSVQDKNSGFVSPYEAECHACTQIVNSSDDRRFRVYKEFYNEV